jgi:hypothetical protein
MDSNLITYRKFNDMGLANSLADVLQQHDIPYVIEEDSLTFNPSFALNDELSKEYEVKINPADFERVNQIALEEESRAADKLEKDYYLFNFSNDELIELIAKADEWSPFDVFHARKILAERGVVISDKELIDLNNQRINELKTTEPPQITWIIIGYVCSIIGGILGIFIGWHLSSYKKTLPNGERVFGYNENDRKHGKIILYLSIVVFALTFIIKMGIMLHDNTTY